MGSTGRTTCFVVRVWTAASAGRLVVEAQPRSGSSLVFLTAWTAVHGALQGAFGKQCGALTEGAVVPLLRPVEVSASCPKELRPPSFADFAGLAPPPALRAPRTVSGTDPVMAPAPLGDALGDALTPLTPASDAFDSEDEEAQVAASAAAGPSGVCALGAALGATRFEDDAAHLLREVLARLQGAPAHAAALVAPAARAALRAVVARASAQGAGAAVHALATAALRAVAERAPDAAVAAEALLDAGGAEALLASAGAADVPVERFAARREALQALQALLGRAPASACAQLKALHAAQALKRCAVVAAHPAAAGAKARAEASASGRAAALRSGVAMPDHASAALASTLAAAVGAL